MENITKCIIDRFPRSLNEAEAKEYLSSSFIRFSNEDTPIGLSALRDLNDEKKYIDLFADLYGKSKLKVAFKETVGKLLAESKWVKGHLTSGEQNQLEKFSIKYSGQLEMWPTESEVLLLVRLSCRDLVFPKFYMNGVTIEGHYEMTFILSCINEGQLRTLRVAVEKADLFTRPIPESTRPIPESV